MLKKLLLALVFVYCASIGMLQAQGYTFFTAPGAETIEQNAIMPAESGVYFCMKKNATQSSLYWLQNNVATEVKNVGNQNSVVINENGSYGKQWFTFQNKALFMTFYGLPGVRTSGVWVTDGTALGTDTLFTYGYGTNVNIAGMIGNELYFSTTSNTPYQTVLYKTDFTKAGTSIVKTITKTNLNWNYVDNQKLYLNGYLKSGAYSYGVLYSFGTDTTRLLLGQNTALAKVINGNLYAYLTPSYFTRKNLSTNVVSSVYIPDTKEVVRFNHVAKILGVQNNKLFIQVNLTGPDNIPNLRIYAGDISSATGTINFVEIRSNADVSIPLYNLATKFVMADNISYFYGINGYGKPVSIFSTDGTVAGTKLVQELSTNYLWSGASYSNNIFTCGDRVYFYGTDYKIGASLHTGYAFSSGDANSGALSIIDLNAGANAQIQDIQKFQDKFIYTIGATTTNKIYALNACSAPPSTAINEVKSAQLGAKIYPNPSNGNFTLEIKENAKNSKLEIYNSMGQKLYSQKINTPKTIINSNLKSGIYFVNVVDGSNKVQTNRVIFK
jgi:hypothetical protein